MSAKKLTDRLVTVLAAVAAPTVALLIDTGTVSGQVGVDIGGLVAAVVAGYHGGSVITSRSGASYHVVDPPD